MAPWTRAIARITLGGDDGYRGTGALIANSGDGGYVLTAFHVIADRAKSMQLLAPSFLQGRMEIVFGDPKNDPWKCGDGTAALVPDRYSIEDDWALLKVVGNLQADPLPLAKATELRRDFQTFGFPRREAITGGEYFGTIGVLQSTRIELHVANLPLQAEMNGISGAPCLVDGQIVGIILQSLANDRDQAIKASLYMLPIERAIEGYKGLLEWDDGSAVTFEGKVETSLPNDRDVLQRAGKNLNLAEARRVRRQIARRLLASDVETAANALFDCQLEPLLQAKPIIECVGAMGLHVDAVKNLRTARLEARTPIVTAATKRIHTWYLQRAFPDQKIDTNRIVVVRLRAGDEELPLEEIVVRIRTSLRSRVNKELVDAMFSTAAQTAAQAERRRFWVILVGERRVDVVDELRARLPNAQITMGQLDPSGFPDRFTTIAPLMTAEQENELIEAWQSSASYLNVPVEPEEDGT